MAEKRCLSKVISISEKVNELPDLFDMLLFTWIIPHTDDYGRLGGSASKVKALVVPMLSKSIKDVKESLTRLQDSGLISWYEGNGETVIQINDFDKHQEGLKRKSPSKYPPPENRHLTLINEVIPLNDNEIEEMVIKQLEANDLIENDFILSTERQLRVNNSYIDILAVGRSDMRYLFEIKRQRLSNTAIDQVVKYRDMIEDDKVSVLLIGNGLASNFDMEKCRSEHINVLVYDNFLQLDQLLFINVKCRQITLSSNRTELNRTEQNRTEENRTEQKGREERDEEDEVTGSPPSPVPTFSDPINSTNDSLQKADLISKHFCTRRAKGFDVSAKDFMLIREIVEFGVSVESASSSIDKCFSEFVASHPRDEISTFSYCASRCYSDWNKYLEKLKPIESSGFKPKQHNSEKSRNGWSGKPKIPIVSRVPLEQQTPSKPRTQKERDCTDALARHLDDGTTVEEYYAEIEKIQNRDDGSG